MEKTNYRPSILRLGVAHDRMEYDSLMSHSEGLIISDTIVNQLEDYIKSVHPSRRFKKEDLTLEVERHLDGRNLNDYGVWVHYPWSKRLVHLLDEEEFVTVRTNRNNYKITHAEQETLAEKKIGLIGLSVGHAVALSLALERSFGELIIADFDELDLSNLNRIRSAVYNIGIPKTVMVAREIAELDPYLNVTCYHDGVTDENIEAFVNHGGGLDILIDECDSLDVKIAIREKAKLKGIPVVMETSDRGMLDIERFDLDQELPILHGLVEGLDSARLKGLSNEEKIPFVLPIIGLEKATLGLRASLVEIERTISTWPQLGADVTLGGGSTANVVRRMMIGKNIPHGRYYVDVDTIIPEQKVKKKDDSIARSRPDHLDLIQRAEKLLVNEKREESLIDQQVLLTILEKGCKAPSAGNCQPWLWHQFGNTLVLYLDTSLPANIIDYKRCSSLLALGAAAENVHLAATAAGLFVEMFPRDIKEDEAYPIVATFTLIQSAEVREADLYKYIDYRITNRMNDGRVPLPKGKLETVHNAYGQSDYHNRLSFIDDPQKIDKVKGIVSIVDRLTMLNEKGHRDLYSEFSWKEDFSESEGINVHSLGLTPMEMTGLKIAKDEEVVKFIRGFKGGKRLGEMSHKTLDSSSAIGLLHIDSNEALSYYKAGMDLQRVWLGLTANGLYAQPISGVTLLLERLKSGGGGIFSELEQEMLLTCEHLLQETFDIGKDKPVFMFRVSINKAEPIPANRKDLSKLLI